jgi:transaldolase
MNPLLQLRLMGQSIWLDYIQRDMLVNGEIERMIEADGLAGITSNPAIFEKAISTHHDYDKAIARLVKEGADANSMYESLVLEDVSRAADLFRTVYDATHGSDGYVSLEVSPHLAHDTNATVGEGLRLWQLLDKPNIMIKVPATMEGIPAMCSLIAAGVNVNATLLFSVARYELVADAYLSGLEQRMASGQAIDRLASVASFFLSRIDTLVDHALDGRENNDKAGSLRGETAIACARLAYQAFKKLFAGPRWESLTRHGARVQRLLWASTSTKEPGYSDVKYVDALIGPDTVNTLPPQTLEAYRDHGKPSFTLEQDLDRAGKLTDQLQHIGIDLSQVAQQLEDEGVEKFNAPFDKLLATLEQCGSRK